MLGSTAVLVAEEGDACGAWIDGDLVVAGRGGGDGDIGDLGLLIGCPRHALSLRSPRFHCVRLFFRDSTDSLIGRVSNR